MKRLLPFLLLLPIVAFGQEVFPPGEGTPSSALGWPLLAPDGTEAAPSYGFLNDTDMGCHRGLAAVWGFDSLVCTSEDFSDLEGAALQLSSGPPNLFFLYATDASANGATVFGQDPSAGATPWAGLTLTAADYTTGTGADTSISMVSTTAGVATIEVYAASDGAGDSTTTFESDETVFTDPIRLPSILFANLGTPGDGTIAYCSDCTKATPCAGAGSGALAKRINGAWDCD